MPCKSTNNTKTLKGHETENDNALKPMNGPMKMYSLLFRGNVSLIEILANGSSSSWVIVRLNLRNTSMKRADQVLVLGCSHEIHIPNRDCRSIIMYTTIVIIDHLWPTLSLVSADNVLQ